jgi:hypothetical protein
VGKFDEIRELAEKLGALKERKRGIELEIKEIESKLNSKSRQGSKASDSKDVEDQVLKIIDAEPDKVFSVKTIEPLLPGVKRSTIRAAFSRLSPDKIRRTKVGRYQSLLAKQQ